MLDESTILFETESGSRYLYDDNSGAVMPVTDLLLEALELYRRHDAETARAKLLEKHPAPFVEGTLKFIERWRRSYGGFFRTERDKSAALHSMTRFGKDDVATILSQGDTTYRQLILNVTEDCNLRCKYCIFSANYQHTRRPTRKVMDFETGRKAIDYFFSLNEPMVRRNPAKQLAINFYGGEPLLARPTVARLIDYARRSSRLPHQFFMTSNALLLDDEAADFVVENDIHLAISLDGTRDNHDRNRITTAGQGSWDVVYGNVTRFMQRHPEFARRNLSIICVYDLDTDLEANARFFEDEELPRISFVDAVSPGSDDDNYYDRFSDDDRRVFEAQSARLMQRYFRDLMKGVRSPDFVRVFCGSRFLSVLVHARAFDRRPEMLPFTGCCLPGEKISVRTDGTFDMCERVNSSMPIGHVDRGLDMEAIARVVKRYNAALGRKCTECPVTKMCGVCFGDGVCMKNGSFEVSEESRCRDIRDDQAHYLSVVYSILERKPDAFRWLNEMLERPERRNAF